MKSLIINSPYVRPSRHWVETRPNTPLAMVEERRPAGYEIFNPRHHTKRIVTLDRVNEIRTRLESWQQAGRPGITSITRSLLDHWHDTPARTLPFYFCQLEAIETLIWWVEAEIERNECVASYAKNDHLGFHVFYLWNGSKRKYIPDFLIQLKNGTNLILEVKGEDSQQNHAKRQALDEWIQAVNNKGGFGTWAAEISFLPADIPGLLMRNSN